MTDIPPTRFGLLRHVETEWNLLKKIQGVMDVPLTESGIATARMWGGKLAEWPWDRILCSSLGRAVRTAEIINERLNLPIDHEPLLIEQDWGRWTGRTIAGLRETEGDEVAIQEAAGWQFQPPGGEDRITLLDRAKKALLEAGKIHPGKHILVVCHGGVIKALVKHLAGREYLPHEPKLVKNNHLQWVICTNGKLELEEVNAVDLGRSRA